MANRESKNGVVILLGSFMFLLFAVMGIYLFVMVGEKLIDDIRYSVNDSHMVTAKLVGYTTRTVDEIDGDYGTKTRTIYRCQWQYEVSGLPFTVTRNQYSKPSSITTLRINTHYPYNVVSGSSGSSGAGVALLLPLGAIGFSLIFLRAVYVEIKYPGTSFLSRTGDD